MRISTLAVLVSLLVPGLSAAPSITAVQNAASNINAMSGSPSAAVAGIAQGAIFVIKGSGLGPAKLAMAPLAFRESTLSGTSVAIHSGSTVIDAPLYYTSDGQVAALLPSNTPPGSAAITVTYNGQVSPPANINVATTGPGIFTIDSTGQGSPAVVTYPDYGVVSAYRDASCNGPNTTCGAANPGDTLILWATGLGPVNGSDSSGAGLGQNMPDLPLSVWVGGLKASVLYQGRSGCCIGEDQIVFTVPANTLTGCAVPLSVQIGNRVSNNTSIPIANGSHDCTPSDPVLAAANINAAVRSGPITFADITLRHRLNGVLPPKFFDSADFEFFRINDFGNMRPFAASFVDQPPTGACLVNWDGHLPLGDSAFAPLDAGSDFTITGPAGSVPVKGQPGHFNMDLSDAGSFVAPGMFTLRSSGGKDVGAFSASVTLPQSPLLTAPADRAAVTRANGMTVTWTGGTPGALVAIDINTPDASGEIANRATCVANSADGTFNIPPYILLSLPPSDAGIVLRPLSKRVPISASGLTLGTLSVEHDGAGYGFGAGTGNFILR